MYCTKCNNLIPITSRSTKYCSKRCSKLYLKQLYRKRNPNKVKQWRIAYLSGAKSLTKKQRIATFEYFDNKCFRCEGNKLLQVHHIKPLSKNGNNNARNLMLLCNSCHTLWHDYFTNYWP